MPLPLLALIVACGTPTKDGSPADSTDTGAATDTGDETDSAVDTATDTGPDTAPPDLQGDVVPTADGCVQVDGIDVPGAATYFLGQYVGSPTSPGRWSGTETWLLYANASWRALGGEDCRVRWTIQGDTVAGGPADVRIAVSATLDASETTCPEALHEGDETFDVTYDVTLAADGTATWAFASGRTLATNGAWNDAGMAYLTERACSWF